MTLSDMAFATEIVGLCRVDIDLSDHKPVRALLRPKTHQSLFPEGYLPGYQNKHAGRQVLLNNLVSYLTCPVKTSLYNYLVSRLHSIGPQLLSERSVESEERSPTRNDCAGESRLSDSFVLEARRVSKQRLKHGPNLAKYLDLQQRCQ